MIISQNSKRRSHFNPESQYLDDFLRAQKNALLLTVTKYIDKEQTKDETLANLTVIKEQLPTLCSAYMTK